MVLIGAMILAVVLGVYGYAIGGETGRLLWLPAIFLFVAVIAGWAMRQKAWRKPTDFD